MAVDYRRQYTPEQLEPLWPSGIIRLTVASLCTLAVMTVLAVLPVILDHWGMGDWIKESEPADPRVTPIHIRPEWYFLAAYQCLKLFPSEFLGLSGKTLGVATQAAFMLAAILLPFWARRGGDRAPGMLHGLCVTLVIVVLVAFTFWAVWPPRPLMAITVCSVVLLFYVLIAGERRSIRRVFRRRKGAPK